MSTITGYGFRVYVSDEKLNEFIRNHADTVKKLESGQEILDWLDSGSTDSIKEKFFDYTSEATNCGGIYGLIADVMSYETDVHFEYYFSNSPEDDDDMIVFIPTYPWIMSDTEKTLTLDSLNTLIKGYLQEINSDLQIDYQFMYCNE